jgi:hypothetical protein
LNKINSEKKRERNRRSSSSFRSQRSYHPPVSSADLLTLAVDLTGVATGDYSHPSAMRVDYAARPHVACPSTPVPGRRRHRSDSRGTAHDPSKPAPDLRMRGASKGEGEELPQRQGGWRGAVASGGGRGGATERAVEKGDRTGKEIIGIYAHLHSLLVPHWQNWNDSFVMNTFVVR